MSEIVDEKKIKYSGAKGIPYSKFGFAFVERSSWAAKQPAIDYKKCIQCQFCWLYCPDTAIERDGLKPIVNEKECKGCGICAAVCPVKAIEMKKWEKK